MSAFDVGVEEVAQSGNVCDDFGNEFGLGVCG